MYDDLCINRPVGKCCQHDSYQHLAEGEMQAAALVAPARRKRSSISPVVGVGRDQSASRRAKLPITVIK